jgi:CheY-specific phosphatase CheX
MHNESGAIKVIIEGLFLNAATELLAAYKLSYKANASSDERLSVGDESILSVITASGEGLRISCTLNIGVDTAMSLHHDVTDLNSAQDLCAEFNNQLIGKLKNKLLAYNCKVLIGLPSLIHGSKITRTPSHSADSTDYTFYCDAGALLIDLQTSIHPGLAILDEPDESLSGTVSEGTLDFF